MNQGWCHDCGRQYMWADNNSSNCPDCSAALSELRAIARTLAGMDPLEERSGRYEDDYYVCVFCAGCSPTLSDPVKHKPDCPWVRARKAVGMDI